MDKEIKIQREIPSQEIRRFEDERELLETSDAIKYMASSVIRNSSERCSNFQKANPTLKNICTFPFKNGSMHKASAIAKNAHVLPDIAAMPKHKRHH